MSFVRGFTKAAASKQQDKEVPVSKAFGAGATLGAAVHMGHDAYLNKKEQKLPNQKSIKKFIKQLKPGDVIISGSTPRNAGSMTVGDLPKSVQKLLRGVGIKKTLPLYNNSTLLNLAGASGKYHSGVYTGKGRMVHLTTDAGATSETLKDALRGQNIAAYRFTDATKREMESAARYSKRMAKQKTPYQSLSKYLPQGISNLVSPVGKPACRKRKDGLVCNTLPVRAYEKRKFTSQGEWTYSGDLRKAKNFKPVARREVVKIPFSLKLRNKAGQSLKGIKWGLAAAGGAAAANKLLLPKKPKAGSREDA